MEESTLAFAGAVRPTAVSGGDAGNDRQVVIFGRDMAWLAAPPPDGAAGGAGEGTSELDPAARTLLDLADGRLTVAGLAEASGLDPSDVARHVYGLYRRGLLLPIVSGREAPLPAPAAPSPPPSQSGRVFRIDEYEIAIRIARGGMGSVYVCRRVGAAGFQRLFALKVMRQHAAHEAAVLRAFLQEARIGGLLNHPNVQAVEDVGTYSGQPFLILDYIEGVSLADMVGEGRRPPPGVIVAILLDVLQGLQHAHDLTDGRGARLGLVHGDVSPPNILVGVDGVARLTDFGSARLTREVDDHPDRLGKPAYMAPEQLRSQPVDARTDVFAAGAVLWSALTGQELFAAETYEQVAAKILDATTPPPSDHGGPAGLDAVCLRALAREPVQRFASADEMAECLRAAAEAHGLIAPVRTVALYVRTEFEEVLARRRRRLQAAFAPDGGGEEARGDDALPAAGAWPPGEPGAPAADGEQGEQGQGLMPTLILPQRPVREAHGAGRVTWGVRVLLGLMGFVVGLAVMQLSGVFAAKGNAGARAPSAAVASGAIPARRAP